MRLPEPSSSNGGPFAAPVRGRDSLSYTPSPDSLGLPTTGAGFFRAGVDFNSIFSGIGTADLSAPKASESAPIAPPATEPTEKTSQAEREDESIEPWDEEEDEAVEENDSINVQPIALAVEAPAETKPIAAGGVAEEAGTAEHATDPQQGLTTAASKDAASQANEKSRSAAQSNATDDAAAKRQASGEATNTADSFVEAKKSLSDTAAESVETELANVTGDPSAETSTAELAAKNLAETASSEAAGAELAAQTLNERATFDAGQSASSVDGEDSSQVRSGRHGRGRNAGSSVQKGRGAQAEPAAKNREEVTTKDAESRVDQAAAVDAGLASGATETAAMVDPEPAPWAPPTADASAVQEPIVSGPVAGGTTPDAANRGVSGSSPSAEMASVGPSSNDSSANNGDRSSRGVDQNLSRTDIADRARLIHRITKAFTKMGTDGGQIRMKMHPETLGGVLLEMRVRGRNVEATVTADNEAARGLLQQQLSELRQRLESQGMTVQRLEVALRDESATDQSWLSDHRGEMSGGDRGLGDNSDSRRGYAARTAAENAARTANSSAIQATGSQSNAGTSTRSLNPAAPGTLDLRL